MAQKLEHACPVVAKGEVFRSLTEAQWSLVLSRLGIDHTYEPVTFEFPDGTIYTPDFLLTALNRFVEIKNGNADNVAYKKLNDLARHLGRHTVLLDGNPKNAKAYVFDGRPPEDNWQEQSSPVSGIAFEEIHGHNVAVVVNRLLQPDAYSPVRALLSLPHSAKQIVDTSRLEIGYQVTAAQQADLQNKLFDPTHQRVVLPPLQEEPGRYTDAPPRRTNQSYPELDPVNTTENFAF